MIAQQPMRLGKFDFSVACSDKPSDKAQRMQALTDWLLFNWHKQREERDAQTTRARAAG